MQGNPVVVLQIAGKVVQPGLCLGVQDLAGPLDDPVGRIGEALAWAFVGRPVVVVALEQGETGPSQEVDAIPGMGSVAHDIAQDHSTGYPGRAQVIQYGLQGGAVGVDIGEDGQPARVGLRTLRVLRGRRYLGPE